MHATTIWEIFEDCCYSITYPPTVLIMVVLSLRFDVQYQWSKENTPYSEKMKGSLSHPSIQPAWWMLSFDPRNSPMGYYFTFFISYLMFLPVVSRHFFVLGDWRFVMLTDILLSQGHRCWWHCWWCCWGPAHHRIMVLLGQQLWIAEDKYPPIISHTLFKTLDVHSVAHSNEGGFRVCKLRWQTLL